MRRAMTAIEAIASGCNPGIDSEEADPEAHDFDRSRIDDGTHGVCLNDHAQLKTEALRVGVVVGL